MLVILAPERQRQEDPWCSLASQPSLAIDLRGDLVPKDVDDVP